MNHPQVRLAVLRFQWGEGYAQIVRRIYIKPYYMQSSKTKLVIILPVSSILVTFTVLGFPFGEDQYAYSQSTTNAAAAGVDLKDTHTSPSHLKAGSKFEIFSTVINNSPSIITFIAGACDSPLSANFVQNVLINHTQGCTAASPPFKLNPGELVSVAGPGSGTIYQAIKAGQTSATATFYYQTENGQTANVTKPFVFTIS